MVEEVEITMVSPMLTIAMTETVGIGPDGSKITRKVQKSAYRAGNRTRLHLIFPEVHGVPKLGDILVVEDYYDNNGIQKYAVQYMIPAEPAPPAADTKKKA